MTKGQKNLQILFLAVVVGILLLAWPHLSFSALPGASVQKGGLFNWSDAPSLGDMPVDYSDVLPRLTAEIEKELTQSSYDGTALDLVGTWQRGADAETLQADSWLWAQFTENGRGTATRRDNQTVSFNWSLREEAYQGEDVILLDYDRSDMADEAGLVSWYSQTALLAVDEDGVASLWNKQLNP